MLELGIKILNAQGQVKAEQYGQDEVNLFYKEEYQEGDQIVFTTSKKDVYLNLQVDDALGMAFTYVTNDEIIYQIPFGVKRLSYAPKVFTGNRHLLSARTAMKEEIGNYRNLALNVMDQHGDTGCYPHATANVETRGESVFAARNAIDGIRENHSHGEWPYQSWGINRQEDAEIKLDFGRMIQADKLVLYTRADFPHDNWWVKVTVTFSDGTSEIWKLEKSDRAHVLLLESKKISWLMLGELVKADDPSPFPALTQLEVYGREV
ncbi:hypothetical protein acsn021_08730 [Anaerocolumna cellulosilytica]|uniref:Uncharacterized protein n=1 Tax=Anaerocolumna cellulosilytica TaxID=433286 RepID=A0A6S6QRS4_9FIRM|nr:carbohydrate-binding protein [Anaerocolumna cellulosilytica]MBB5194361.1 hypothetical protein [Anaerocolumna cellulosilytica]BCJ93304.1 hypothetical protein acsn021_08730 [Anaerocolumna cellulosilytica]